MRQGRWNPRVIETPPGSGPIGGIDYRSAAILALQKTSSMPKVQRDALFAIACIQDANVAPQAPVAMLSDKAGLKPDRFLFGLSGLIERGFLARAVIEPRPHDPIPWVLWTWGDRIEENRRTF